MTGIHGAKDATSEYQAVQQQRTISTGIEELLSAIEGLHTRIDRLEDQLSPILAPDVPKGATNGVGQNGSRMPICQLDDQIESARQFVLRVTEKADNLRHRISL